MNHFGSEGSKPWRIYTSSDLSPSQSMGGGTIERDAPWKNFGTSMNAIAFGFVATAILISMFLVMAIFEHLFRPNQEMRTSSPSESHKLGNQHRVTETTTYASDCSVLMPGNKYPTYIAQPAPLPCPREGIYWPNHQHNNLVFP